MFAKDHFSDWGEKTKPSDWLGVPYSEILEMQPYRKIVSEIARKK